MIKPPFTDTKAPLALYLETAPDLEQVPYVETALHLELVLHLETSLRGPAPAKSDL